jgi:predicted TIM-barrel fold metal-dependent hydrolase
VDSGFDKNRGSELKPPHVRGMDTREMLAHARRQGEKRKLDDYFIVDVDAHHYENQSWSEILDCMPNDVMQFIGRSFTAGGNVTPGLVAVSGYALNQPIGGRVVRGEGLEEKIEETSVHRDVSLIRRAMESLNVDYQITFPTPMLGVGLHPEVEVEVAVADGYNRWLTERVLPGDDRIKSMLYLPFNDPDACIRTVEQFAGKKGVVGFMVTSVRHRPVHHNSYMPLYRMLEERGLPLGFHAGPTWSGEHLRQLNRFISMHSISFVLCNMIHLTNWVINALPERFPKLKVTWIESGIAWIPFMMQRLDSEYLMRSSEAPGLKRLPSDYIKEMFFTSQPLERTNMRLLEVALQEINAKSQLMYSSDWPHWDFDVPSVVFDLPFLDDQARRNILGLNAKRLFNLPDKESVGRAAE